MFPCRMERIFEIDSSRITVALPWPLSRRFEMSGRLKIGCKCTTAARINIAPNDGKHLPAPRYASARITPAKNCDDWSTEDGYEELVQRKLQKRVCRGRIRM